MSWNNPKNIEEAAASVTRGYSWDARCDLAGSYVAVLSHAGMSGTLRDRSHALTDHVLTGAERYRDDYMAGEGRKPHPSVTIYYVLDKRSGRVVLAKQADGTVLDELDTVRPDLKPSTREALRTAIAATPTDTWAV